MTKNKQDLTCLVVKVSKRAKKMPKIVTNWTYNWFQEKMKILTALSMPNIIIVTKNKQDQTCEPGRVAIASG